MLSWSLTVKEVLGAGRRQTKAYRTIGNQKSAIKNTDMRILIADKFEDSGRNGLQALGCEVFYQPDLKDEAFVEAIRKERPHVLIVRGTKVTEPMLDAGPVKLIVRAGAGYNTIDVAAASRRGIYVSNCPGQNSTAVAELA